MTDLPLGAKRQNRREPSIFISHSSRDIIVARSVRNLLEDRNHNFVGLIGLASFSGRPKEEIFRLLSDEIKARDWLILIDSENAQQSEYVQFEIEFAKSIKKPFYTIQCDRFSRGTDRYEIERSLVPCIAVFSRGLRLFFSYQTRDMEFVKQLSQAMVDQNFEVWLDQENITPGVYWESAISEAIDSVLDYGVFVVFLSRNSLRSQYVHAEIDHAVQQRAMILPILLEQINYSDLPISLQKIQYLDVSHLSTFNEKRDEIIRVLNSLRWSRFNELCGGEVLNMDH